MNGPIVHPPVRDTNGRALTRANLAKAWNQVISNGFTPSHIPLDTADRPHPRSRREPCPTCNAPDEPFVVVEYIPDGESPACSGDPDVSPCVYKATRVAVLYIREGGDPTEVSRWPFCPAHAKTITRAARAAGNVSFYPRPGVPFRAPDVPVDRAPMGFQITYRGLASVLVMLSRDGWVGEPYTAGTILLAFILVKERGEVSAAQQAIRKAVNAIRNRDNLNTTPEAEALALIAEFRKDG